MQLSKPSPVILTLLPFRKMMTFGERMSKHLRWSPKAHHFVFALSHLIHLARPPATNLHRTTSRMSCSYVRDFLTTSNVVVGGVLPVLVPRPCHARHRGAKQARTEAFTLVVTMSQSMRAGGTVHRKSPDIKEFMTILVGSLAGASPHMISAIVITLSRVAFRFKGGPRERARNVAAGASLCADKISVKRCAASCLQLCLSSCSPRTGRSQGNRQGCAGLRQSRRARAACHVSARVPRHARLRASALKPPGQQSIQDAKLAAHA
jgi:hypothetical protein